MTFLTNLRENQNSFYKASLFVAFIFGYLGVFLVFSWLEFNFLQSDAQAYWQDSLTLSEPFHPFHVPGYPVVIALFRILTGFRFAPIFYLQLIALLSFCLALFLVFEISKIGSGSNGVSLISALLFMLWPMVGLTYVVYPVADSLAMALYLLGVYLLLKERPVPGALAWMGALFVHKAMWIFVVISFLMWVSQPRSGAIKRVLIYGAIIFAPLLLFTVLGSFYHHSLTWIVSSNLNVEVSSKSNAILFDGLLGTLGKGGLSALAKGGIIMSQLMLAGYVAFQAIKHKNQGWEFGFAIGIATLILLTFLNQYEIWAAVRFGRLLAIPIVGGLSISRFFETPKAAAFGNISVVLLGILLYASQLFYAWYMITFFRG